MMKRNPLFLKLFYSFIPAITLGLLTLTVVVNYSTQNFYQNLIKQQLNDRTSNIISWLNTIQLNDENIQNICQESSNDKSVRVTIINTMGTVIGDSHNEVAIMDNHLNRPEIIEANKTGIGYAQRYSKTLKENLMYFAVSDTIQNENWIVRVSIPIAEYRSIISDLQNKIILFGIFVSIALLYISYFISKQITAPIENIRKKTEEYVSTLKMSQPLEIPNTKELASLALSLNKMAKELNKRIKQIQNEKDDKESLLSSMQEGIIAINNNNKIISINNIAIEYLNLTKKTLLKEKYTKVIKNEAILSIIETSIKKDARQYHVFEKEIEIIKNKRRFFLINSSPLIRSNKNKGVVIVLNDITLKKQLEKVRQDFVANVSHELKTPITSIVGFVEILNQTDLSKSEHDLFLSKILNHTNRMNAIIDDLLKLSKIESQEEDDSIILMKQNLYTILDGAKEDMKDHLANRRNIVEIDCDDDILVNADAQLLREAFVNLLENAGKYGFSDTPIKISVNAKKRLHIHFDNYGEEIKKKHWERIFQRFYRVDKSRDREAGGTGLGLAIVKHITFVHGGEIKVFSSENKKTRFTIMLPLVSKNQKKLKV